MKRLLILSLIFFTSNFAFSQEFTHQFMPDNDLHLQDQITRSPQQQEKQRLFHLIIDRAEEIYGPIAEENKETLTINRLWDDSTVNANVTRIMYPQKKVIINLFGGLFRRSEVTPQGFALVLSHELSHAYGGAPYISPARFLSAEGVADHTGAQILKHLDLYKDIVPVPAIDELVIERCLYEEEFDICIMGVSAGQSLSKLLNVLGGNKEKLSLFIEDPYVTSTTMLSYPLTTQCRLDSYIRGTLNQPRPLCWFKP